MHCDEIRTCSQRGYRILQGVLIAGVNPMHCNHWIVAVEQFHKNKLNSHSDVSSVNFIGPIYVESLTQYSELQVYSNSKKNYYR